MENFPAIDLRNDTKRLIDGLEGNRLLRFEVAKILDAKVILNPLIQERTHPNYAPIKGLSFEELCGSFGDLIDRKVPLKYPWVYTDNIGNTEYGFYLRSGKADTEIDNQRQDKKDAKQNTDNKQTGRSQND